MEKLDTWHDRLAYAMKKRGIKPVRLAKATENSPASVSDWISGKTKMMGADNAVRTGEFLSVNLHWLFLGKGASGLEIPEEARALSIQEPTLAYENTTPENERWPLKGISPNRWASLKPEYKKSIISIVDDLITKFTGEENPNKRASN